MKKDLLIIRFSRDFREKDFDTVSKRFKQQFDDYFYTILIMNENRTIKTEFEIVSRNNKKKD